MNDAAASRSFAERTLDQVLPDDLDWQEKVKAYPLTSLAVATALGFFLGRTKGRQLLSAVTGFAADRVADSLHAVVDPPDA